MCCLHDAQELEDHVLQPLQHRRYFLQPFATAQLFDIVDDDFDTQYPVGLVVHFQSQFAKVQFQEGQVVHRRIQDHLQSPVPTPGFKGTTFTTEDGFQPRYIQQAASAVEEPLIDFI